MTLRDWAASALEGAMLSGRPDPGAAAADRTPARGLGISRAPLREAISGLRDEGLSVRPRAGRAPAADALRQELHDDGQRDIIAVLRFLDPSTATEASA